MKLSIVKDIKNEVGKNLKEEYQMSLCVEKYYELQYSHLLKQNTQNNALNDTLKIMIENIMNGSMTRIQDENIDSTTNGLLKTLIDACNTLLIPHNKMNDEELEINEVYLEEQKKVKKLQKELSKKENVEKELNEKKEQYELLKKEYENEKKKLEEIQKILNQDDLTILKKSL